MLVPVLVILVVLALLWLGIARHRRPSANTPACASCASRALRVGAIDSPNPMKAAKKLVLTYVDSLRTDMLERAVEPRAGRRPSRRCWSAACSSPTASPASPR